MHEKGDGAQNTLGAVNQADDVSQAGLTAQVQNSSEGGVVMLRVPELNEQEPASEVIDDGLPSAEMPPLDRVVVLPARYDQPVRDFEAGGLAHERGGSLLGVGQIDVPLELGR